MVVLGVAFVRARWGRSLKVGADFSRSGVGITLETMINQRFVKGTLKAYNNLEEGPKIR